MAQTTGERARVQATDDLETLRREHGELQVRAAELAADLSRAGAELNLFTAMLVHELQEPLRKIQMFGELMNTPEASGAGAEYGARMQDAGRRMGRLISDILSLSRVTIDAKRLERVELDAVLTEVAADYAVLLDDVGGRLEVGPLPAVRGDASQLRQLFGNLLSNAAKFRRPDEALRITVSSRPAPPGFVALEVADNGFGFEEKYARKIFEPFQRLHRRTEYEGSGMGLAICARIAARHAGTLEAHGEPGRGAVFAVTLKSP